MSVTVDKYRRAVSYVIPFNIHLQHLLPMIQRKQYRITIPSGDRNPVREHV